jgi:hypothetical protein
MGEFGTAARTVSWVEAADAVETVVMSTAHASRHVMAEVIVTVDTRRIVTAP